MAATGTPTPNIGLRIPQGTDPASVDDINYNSNLLDTKLGAVGNTSVQDQIDSLNSNAMTTATVIISNATVGVNWIRKRSNMVTLSLLINASATIGSSWVDIATIPSGYRPLNEVRFNMIAKGGGIIDTRITTDGYIQGNSDASISSPMLRFTVSYPV